MATDETAASTEATQVDHRKLPRRHGEVLNAAIFEATIAELAERGYAALTMEGIAERARASKASLYRRWPNRADLVRDAVYHQLPNHTTIPDTGALRDDVIATLRSVADQMAGPLGEAFKVMLSDLLRDPARAAELQDRSRGTSVRIMREIGDRAVRRGEIDPAALSPRRLEVGQAMLRHYFLFHGAPIPDEFVTSVVDEVILPLFHAPPGADPAG